MMQPQVENKGLRGSNRQALITDLDRRFSRSGIRRKQISRVLGGSAWLAWVQVVTGIKRIVDVVFSLALLAAFSPLLVALLIAVRLRGGGIARIPKLGRWACTYHQLAFTSGPLRGLPALLNVLRGDMSLVGPRAISPCDVTAADRNAWRRFAIRPGLVCLWWIRQRANIAYGGEFETDSEYLDTHSLAGDLAIGLRALPAAFFGRGVELAPDRIDLLGIPVNNLTMDEAISSITGNVKAGRPSQVCFVNADCVNIAYRDRAYRELLRHCGTVLADGIGIKLAGRILNTNIRQNVNGTDLFPRLCAEMERQRLGLYLLGGRPGVPDDVANWISEHYPTLEVRGYRHGYFGPEETQDVVGKIRESRADVLLVAFGAPKQDKWIREHLEQLRVPVSIGVGGLFDFYSGRIPRAPVWMREIGMEWFYRFMNEPRRMWRRYFVGNIVFLWRAISWRIAGGAAA
ncbi:MAG TPA: WecB/TagA/CpsF family glycosyltransferase [Bryobacteraceae bacterium]|nr:WecB/TagA/CpsF family glycosyltransferase [Bryobacteraceae bacterium]